MVLLLLMVVGAANTAAPKTPVKLIIDTDIGGGGCNDVDDVVAVCIGHALEQRGEAELLAIVQNTAPLQCAGVISVLNHFYGKDDLPIGAYNISTPGATLEQEDPLPYVPLLANGWPSKIKNTTQVPSAVSVYRKVLASQSDQSVTISSIGIHTNLAALLKSKPDEYSPLDGSELVRQKVKLLAVMGGKYGGMHGSHAGGPACNLCGGCGFAARSYNVHNHLTASAASSYVADHWPSESKLIWSGFEVGVSIQSGGSGFQRCAVAAACKQSQNSSQCDPCAAAMINYEGGPDKSRFSWDPLTTLVAVRGAAGGSTYECHGCKGAKGCCDGRNVIDPLTGNNTWTLGPRSNQTFLVLPDAAAADAAGAAIDELLCQPPKGDFGFGT
jgi:hypothetical protein